MGFDPHEAGRALRAAFGDVNGAVEYLMNGIPDDMALLSGVDGVPADGPAPRGRRASIDAAMSIELSDGDDFSESSSVSMDADDVEGNDAALHDIYREMEARSDDLNAMRERYQSQATEGQSQENPSVSQLLSRVRGLQQETRRLQSLANEAATRRTAQVQSAAEQHPMLDQLRTHPQLMQLRQMLTTAPTSLPQIVTLLSGTNPELAQEITQYPREFICIITGYSGTTADGTLERVNQMVEMINQTAGHPTAQPVSGTAPQSAAEHHQDAEAPAQPPQRQNMLPYMPPQFRGQMAPSVQTTLPSSPIRASALADDAAIGQDLTDEDRAKIEQIVEMTGSASATATEAYIACGKNMESAINFLFDN